MFFTSVVDPVRAAVALLDYNLVTFMVMAMITMNRMVMMMTTMMTLNRTMMLMAMTPLMMPFIIIIVMIKAVRSLASSTLGGILGTYQLNQLLSER